MKFKELIWSYYRRHGRKFIWREDPTPYHVLISEIMLQQTQTSRVEVKYQEFLALFPTLESLARAPLSKVLQAWQGLGYNRRGKYLQAAAMQLTSKYDGDIPQDPELLKQLPGIGEYTANSIPCFAYNQATVFIETNIRTVYLHHFFMSQEGVADKDILNLISQHVDAGNPREWYWALMDYGVHLKLAVGNLNHRSKHYIKQSKFEGSNRQVRSKLLKLILQKPLTIKELSNFFPAREARIESNLKSLIKEGMIQQDESGLYEPVQ